MLDRSTLGPRFPSGSRRRVCSAPHEGERRGYEASFFVGQLGSRCAFRKWASAAIYSLPRIDWRTCHVVVFDLISISFALRLHLTNSPPLS